MIYIYIALIISLLASPPKDHATLRNVAQRRGRTSQGRQSFDRMLSGLAQLQRSPEVSRAHGEVSPTFDELQLWPFTSCKY